MKVLIDRHAACSFQLKCQKFHRFRTLHGDHKGRLGSILRIYERQSRVWSGCLSTHQSTVVLEPRCRWPGLGLPETPVACLGDRDGEEPTDYLQPALHATLRVSSGEVRTQEQPPWNPEPSGF